MIPKGIVLFCFPECETVEEIVFKRRKMCYNNYCEVIVYLFIGQRRKYEKKNN